MKAVYECTYIEIKKWLIEEIKFQGQRHCLYDAQAYECSSANLIKTTKYKIEGLRSPLHHHLERCLQSWHLEHLLR